MKIQKVEEKDRKDDLKILYKDACYLQSAANLLLNKNMMSQHHHLSTSSSSKDSRTSKDSRPSSITRMITKRTNLLKSKRTKHHSY